MNSKNFKKVLSTSIASLTVLSTLGGSVSTKIYADGGDSIASGAKTQNKDNFDFIVDKVKYVVSLSKDDYEQACKECEGTGTPVGLSYEGFLKIFEAVQSEINKGKEDELQSGQTSSIATSNGNLRGFVRYISKERTEEKYLKATMQFLKRGIAEGNSTEPITEELANKEDKYDFDNVVKQEVTQGNEEQIKTGINGEVSDNIIAPAEISTIEKTEEKTGSIDTDQQSKEGTDLDNKDQKATETDGAKQTPADSQEPAEDKKTTLIQPQQPAEVKKEEDKKEEKETTSIQPQQPAEGKTPAINVSDKSKGSIFKRVFSAIKGFFSNIFNFVCGLFRKVK